MKKAIYYKAIACCLLTLTSCAPSQKRVAPPVAEGRYERPAQTDEGVYTGTGASGELRSRPDYLDITDNQDITIEDVTTETVIPSMEYINDRLFEYGRKLERWKELDSKSLTVSLNQEETEQMVNCFKKLQNVLNGYTRLQEDILQNSSISGSGEVSASVLQELQRNDIEFMESPCGRLLASTEDKGAGWGQREEGADLSQLETLIERYAVNEEHEEVVQIWLQIPPAQIERVNLQTKIRYGNALMYLHQEAQAAEVYKQIVDKMSASKEQPTDLISLRKVLADLYTASGNFPAAEEQYKIISQDYLSLGEIEEWSKLQLSILDRSVKGSPELTEYSALLRNFLGFIPEKDGYKIVWQADEFLKKYPYSAVSSNVDIIKERATKQADAWLSQFLSKVDQLSNEKKYQEAIQFLETVPEDMIDEQKRNELKAMNDELILAEAVERETTKLAQVQELQRQWNSGMLLVKAERFDEAIAVFTEMLNTEYSVKAEEKISEVSLLAAKDARRKAADLFIRFTKTTDPESQKKLLLESHKVLKDILVKYPDVEIAEKVRGNIERVEQEMNAIDPMLLQAADQGAMPQESQDKYFYDVNVREQTPFEPQPPIIEQPLME